MKTWIILTILFLAGVAGFVILSHQKPELKKELPTPAQTKNAMKITSPAFENNQPIDSKYSCDGEGVNPPLEFHDIPQDAKSLVLIMEDPDVPKNLKPDGMFDHWVVFNMPSTTTSVTENSTPPGVVGKNGAGQNGYAAACPPDRQHRYFFKLFALDSMLMLDEAADKKAVVDAMEGHVKASAELIGLYNRPQNSK